MFEDSSGSLFTTKRAPAVRKMIAPDQYGGAAYTPPVMPNASPYATATPSPSIAVGRGFTPDYGALIKSDPGYVSAMSNSTLDVSQAASSRREALRRLAVQYGGLPANTRDAYGDLDEGTLDLAKRNQYSDVSRLGRSYKEGIEGFKKALAARGALQSGELGYGLSQADYARGEREYDAGNAFANAFQSVVSDYVGAESRSRQGQVDAINQAQANVFSNPLNRPVAPATATLVPDSHLTYGQPVYRAPDGRLYTLDGQLFTGYAPQTGDDWRAETGTDSGYSPGLASGDLAGALFDPYWRY